MKAVAAILSPPPSPIRADHPNLAKVDTFPAANPIYLITVAFAKIAPALPAANIFPNRAWVPSMVRLAHAGEKSKILLPTNLATVHDVLPTNLINPKAAFTVCFAIQIPGPKNSLRSFNPFVGPNNVAANNDVSRATPV